MKHVRHTRPHKTPLNERTCDSCTDKTESEYHVILECDKFIEIREGLFNRLQGRNDQYKHMSKDELFQKIMKLQGEDTIHDMGIFIKSMCKIRGNF